jgi:hypothetical protein
LIGCGVPEHTHHQVHTGCNQELFLTKNDRETTGNKCHRIPVCFYCRVVVGHDE